MQDKAIERHASRLKSQAAKRAGEDRDGSNFLSLPHIVIDSPGYRLATHEARSLLVEVASRLYRKGAAGGLPNGGLMIDRKYMADRGWTSNSTLSRAIADLVACGLLAVTRTGGKNRPSLYAVTWAALAVGAGYQLDIDPAKWHQVHRGAYRKPGKALPSRQTDRTAKATAARKAAAQMKKGTSVAPSDGRRHPLTGPSDGPQRFSVGPSDGLVVLPANDIAAPSDGHSLEHCHLRGLAVPLLGGPAPHEDCRSSAKGEALRVASETEACSTGHPTAAQDRPQERAYAVLRAVTGRGQADVRPRLSGSSVRKQDMPSR